MTIAEKQKGGIPACASVTGAFVLPCHWRMSNAAPPPALAPRLPKLGASQWLAGPVPPKLTFFIPARASMR